MTDDNNHQGDEPPVPPVSDGGADPTRAQPTQPAFVADPAAQTLVAPDGPQRPAWLLPFVGGAVLMLVVGLIAFFVTRDGGTKPPPSTAVSEPPPSTVSPPTTEVPPTTEAPPVTTVAPTTIAPTTVPGPCPDGYAEVSAVPFGPCSQGAIVAEVQEILNTVLGAGLDLDGFYGPSSEDVVRGAQADLGFPVDGIVTQEFLDALSPTVPPTTGPTEPSGFVPASPGNVRVDDTEYPIVRTCFTDPGPGFSYLVTSYVIDADRIGTRAIHAFFFRGGGEDATLDSIQSEEYQSLGDDGFGFTILEGDFLSTITVNPDDGADAGECLGTVVEIDPAGVTHVRSIINICDSGAETQLMTSEGGFVGISGGNASGEISTQFSFSDPRSSVFETTSATSEGDESTVRLRATATRTFFDSPDESRDFLIEYPAADYPAC